MKNDIEENKKFRLMNNWQLFQSLNKTEREILKYSDIGVGDNLGARRGIEIEYEFRTDFRNIIKVWRVCKFDDLLTKLSISELILNDYW